MTTRRGLRTIALGLVALLMTGATVWGCLAFYFDGPGGSESRGALAAAWAGSGLAALVAFVEGWRRQRAALAFVAAFTTLLLWWTSIAPSNVRDWQPEVARLARATLDGELVTVRDIRNFDYRTETDFTPAYYDRTFDLRTLDAVDLVASYWMGSSIAHLFLSPSATTISQSPLRRARSGAKATRLSGGSSANTSSSTWSPTSVT